MRGDRRDQEGIQWPPEGRGVPGLQRQRARLRKRGDGRWQTDRRATDSLKKKKPSCLSQQEREEEILCSNMTVNLHCCVAECLRCSSFHVLRSTRPEFHRVKQFCPNLKRFHLKRLCHQDQHRLGNIYSVAPHHSVHTFSTFSFKLHYIYCMRRTTSSTWTWMHCGFILFPMCLSFYNQTTFSLLICGTERCTH